MSVQAKICGVKTPDAIKAACDHGASYLGFNFFPKSPRFIESKTAAELAAHVATGVNKVALFVNADDATMDAILKDFPADIIQLHGYETPARVGAIKARYGKPIIKAFSVHEADDLEEVTTYEGVADLFLFDARPPANAEIPGGNAVAFNWGIMKHARVMKSWFLAGGLTPQNVKDAVEQSGARMVDVASGVERIRGEQDPRRIAAFLKAVAAL